LISYCLTPIEHYISYIGDENNFSNIWKYS